jgi:cytochrome P450
MNNLRIIRWTFLPLILNFALEGVQVHAAQAAQASQGAVGSSNETLDAIKELIHEKLKEFQRQDDDIKQKWVVTALIAVILVLNLSHYWKKSTMSKRFGMPVMHSTPQGPSYPFLGQAINFLRYRPWDLLTNWHRLYGPIVCFNLLGATMFSIASPDLLKVVLQSKIAAVKKDIANTMKPFLTILGTGIVTSEDESWMKQRLKMSNPLRRDVLEIIPRQTLLAVQRLMVIMDKAADAEEQVPLGSSLRHLTLQVISGSFLSLSAEESDSTFAEMYLPIVDESNTRVWHPYRSYLFFLPSFWKYISNVSRLNQYVSKLIRDRWTLRRTEHAANANANASDSREHDILDRVLQVYEKEFPQTQVLPEQAVRQFRDEMKTFMLAGHETSAAMMTWTLYELMGNSELMQRVADEGESIFGSAVDWGTAVASDLPVPDDVARLVLAEASLKVRGNTCRIVD